ncbi:hypothetical protein EMWEY_00028570 [Eimeria maxima]|uniref:Uncharacterized protein n=1 Tax=Eimeria maxima TaxID=5804 RepID=U6MEW2_EIMMA|nr:hypothetical protein EMWEY_00028570 [Eimeria maxima]CDJ60205.1 hypothetical protein EMWEY_00028570 [Eimeria maxima]
MHFVRSSVYQAEITEGGVREREVDTRSREEVELQERLRRLPEFSRNPNFKRCVFVACLTGLLDRKVLLVIIYPLGSPLNSAQRACVWVPFSWAMLGQQPLCSAVLRKAAI